MPSRRSRSRSRNQPRACRKRSARTSKGLALNGQTLVLFCRQPVTLLMSLLRRFLRLFFWHFYHGFAWTYDVVAAVVSIGRWNDWVRAALPYVEGARVLEIGHGPGHLQLDLRQTGRQVMGLDESRQMGRLARNRLLRGRFTEINLVRGIA